MDNQAMLSRRALLALAAASMGTAALAQPATSRGKVTKILVGFPPGQATDIVARLMAEKMQAVTGENYIVDNKPGQGGSIAMGQLAKSPNDGSTMMLTHMSAVATNPHLYRSVPYDSLKDYEAVGLVGDLPFVLVCHPSLPFNDAQGLVAYAKANPGKLSYASPGSGSSPHLAGEMFKSQAGLFALHVPYRGAAPALQDLLAGQVDYAFDPGIGLQQVRAGKLRLLAVGSPQRSPLFPDVPTLDEAGLRGFDADTVFGFYAPAGTPPEVVAQLNAQINRALALPAVKERIASLGGEAVPGTPAELQQRAAADSQRFGALIRERRIAAD